MSLAPGTKLGPYEVIAPIGAGGMGEVYRAKDIKLNRDVTIKVLPEASALDADRLARFTREALPIPTQIADALEAAHVDFAWSPDGKRLAVTRGTISCDIVLIKGIREIAQSTGPSPRTSRLSSSSESGATHADDGFLIAVLPFKYVGSNEGLSAVADGMSEDIVTELSRFSYLRVIARGATKERAARYRIDGSLRQSGSTLRVAAQLVDAMSGAHLWAETYDRPFRADDMFSLQDDLVPRIVATMADLNGVLCRSISDALRGRRPDQLTAYEALLRSFGFNDRVTPEEHADVRALLEHAVRVAPGASDCLAILANTYAAEFSYGFNPRPDPLGRALETARRAVDASRTSQLAYYALALALLFRKEAGAFRLAAERAVSLNPMNSAITAHLGILLAYSGDWEHGCAVIARASEMNPQHPGWYWFGPLYNAYRQGEYRVAAKVAEKIDMPQFYATHEALAVVSLAILHASEGEMTEALAYARRARAIVPFAPQVAGLLAGLLTRTGDVAAGEAIVEGLRIDNNLVPTGLAMFHSLRSDFAEAARWIGRAIDQRDPQLVPLTCRMFGTAFLSSAHWPPLSARMNLPS